jgi:D-alanyl-D-alanine carboxypeptidase/D-alanyl-D-alanine-endopeptidase (penicillin-binding protein 4)
MQQRLLFAALLFLGTSAVFAQDKAAPTPAQNLQEQIQKALDNNSLKKAKIGIYAQNLKTGEVVYSQNADDLLIPASNTKLITTAAALYHLGPDYRFRTLFAIPKDSRKGAKVSGDLFIKGFGDPTLMTKDLFGVADELALLGLKEVTGDIVIDDSFFDDQTSPPGFDDKPKVESSYRAVVSATAVNFNVVSLRIFPGEKSGDPARVVSDPEGSYLQFESEATTSKKSKLDVDCEMEKDHLKCKVKGTIDIDKIDGLAFRKRVTNTSSYFAATFREALKARGISVKGKNKTGTLPKDAETLYISVSDDLSTVIRTINKISNNFMAETILKTMGAEVKGAPGTSANGIEAAAVFLESVGIARGTYKMSNGSGLWGDTQFSPAQMVKILDAVYKDSRIAPDYMSSMAIASADGTLRYRMKNSAASKAFRGKTGTLDGVICLSGYLRLNNQDTIAVSFLFNEVSNSTAAKNAQSKVGAALAEYLIALDPKAAFPDTKFSLGGDDDGEDE